MPRLLKSIADRTRDLPAKTGVILDVPLMAGIKAISSAFATSDEETKRGGTGPWVVLIVGRVSVPGAIMPTEMLHEVPTHLELETVGSGFGIPSPLLDCDWWRQPNLAPDGRPTWFILDGDRQRDVSRSRLKRQLDNRYRYSVDHLPTTDSLRHAGLTDAVLVCEQSVPAPDLEPWVGGLLDDGFAIRVRACA